MNANRLEFSDNQRDGYPLDVGRLWEVDVESTLRNLNVYVSTAGICIVNMWCGELEMAEQQAIHLTVEEALALGEILGAAAAVTEGYIGRSWANNARRADSTEWLREQMHERCQRLDRELAVEREATDSSP